MQYGYIFYIDFGKSLVRNFKQRYVKGNMEGGWLLYDERFISMRQNKSPSDVFGNPLFVNETDQEWTDLFNEIDNYSTGWFNRNHKKNFQINFISLAGNTNHSISSK